MDGGSVGEWESVTVLGVTPFYRLLNGCGLNGCGYEKTAYSQCCVCNIKLEHGILLLFSSLLNGGAEHCAGSKVKM